VTAHSDNDGAAGTFKGGFGFHPLLAYLDCADRAAGGQPLAGLLRAGNAGADDHITVLGVALEQLPRDVVADAEILVRCDSAGATHELLDVCRDARLRFSVGLDLTEPVRDAILALPETAWQSRRSTPTARSATTATSPNSPTGSTFPAGRRRAA
jgi:Transposase DDE domain group 1